MEEFLARPLVRAGLLFAALAALSVLAIFVVLRFRGGAGHDRLQASELLSKFRELHDQGELSAEEFRNIKAKLKDQLEQELKHNDKQG